MEYGKLLAVLLSTVVSERPDSVDQRIAQYIMDHLGDAGAITMRRIEQSCHVGNASISRFCRRIGLRDFFELRELVAAVRFQADADAADPPPAGVDAVLRFDTDFDQRRHPHQMAFVCDTLVREYARMYGLPEAKTPQP